MNMLFAVIFMIGILVYMIYNAFKSVYQSAAIRFVETIHLTVALCAFAILCFITREVWGAVTITAIGYLYYRWKKYSSIIGEIDLDFKPREIPFFQKEYPDLSDEEFEALKEEIKGEWQDLMIMEDIVKAYKKAEQGYKFIPWMWAYGSVFATFQISSKITFDYLKMGIDPGMPLYAGLLPAAVLAFRQFMKHETHKKRQKQKGDQ